MKDRTRLLIDILLIIVLIAMIGYLGTGTYYYVGVLLGWW